MVDTNKKLPLPPSSDAKEKDARYITSSSTPDGSGYQKYEPFDHNEALQYSMEEYWNSTGGYETRSADKNKKELNTSLNYEKRQHHIGGVSRSYETHVEDYAKDTRKVTTEGDHAIETGKNQYIIAAGQGITAYREGKVDSTPGNGDAPTYVLSKGTITKDHDGNDYSVIKQDQMKTIGGNKNTRLTDGDYLLHVQKGAYDVEVDVGKLHLMTLANDLVVNSNVKVLQEVGSLSKIIMTPTSIKFQVGSGSYIEITSSGIQMVSPRIDLN